MEEKKERKGKGRAKTPTNKVLATDLLSRDTRFSVANSRLDLALASCLIYARAFIEYVCGCVLFQDVTVRKIRGR